MTRDEVVVVVVESLDDARARDLLHALAETPLVLLLPLPVLVPPLLVLVLVLLLAGELTDAPSMSGQS